VHEIESLIFLLAAAALLAQLARLLKVPYPILLVLGGLVMGFVPGLPDIEIPPEVIFVAFLPPLLNSAAFSSSPLDLRAQLRPIVMLAVGLVLATMGAVAVIAHAFIGLPGAPAYARPIKACAITATAPIVASTSPTASITIGLSWARRSSGEEEKAAEFKRGGRKATKITSGGISMSGRPGTKPITRPPRTSKIG